MRGHHREDAAGLQGVGGFGDEVVVDAEPLAVVVQLLVGEGDVADHRVQHRQFGVSEILNPDVVAWVHALAIRPEMESSSTPMNRIADGAMAMKRPTPHPGSSTVALGGTPRRSRAWCMAA